MSNELPTTVDMYNVCAPSLLRGLANLKAILIKAAAQAAEKNINESVMLDARLTFDMFPLVKQIQIVTDTAKGAVHRLSDIAPLTLADDETTIDQLLARIDKVTQYIQAADPKLIIGTETKPIVLKFGPAEFPFVGYSFLSGYVLPNFYFHSSIAYAILRANGIVLGKRDFLGA